MIDQGGPEGRRGLPQRLAQTAGRLGRSALRGFREKAIVVSAATIAGGIAAHLPANYINQTYRYYIDYNATEHQAIFNRLKKLQKEKQERGVKSGRWDYKALKHWWERVTGEFGGDLTAWAKESEPILAMRIRHVQIIQAVDWLFYYPFFVALFLFLTPKIYRAIDRYVQTTRGRLTQDRVRELEANAGNQEARIKALEKNSTELKGLEILAKVLMQKDLDTSKLSQEEIAQLQAIVARGVEIFESLPPELNPYREQPKEDE